MTDNSAAAHAQTSEDFKGMGGGAQGGGGGAGIAEGIEDKGIVPSALESFADGDMSASD